MFTNTNRAKNKKASHRKKNLKSLQIFQKLIINDFYSHLYIFTMFLCTTLLTLKSISLETS